MQQHMLRIVRNCELCDYPYCESLFLYLIETFNTHTHLICIYMVSLFIFLMRAMLNAFIVTVICEEPWKSHLVSRLVV